MYDLSPTQFITIVKGSRTLARAEIRRHGMHALPATLDTLVALQDLAKRAAPPLETTERQAFVLGLRAFGLPAPEAGDSTIDINFSDSVCKKMARKLLTMKKKNSKVQMKMRYEEDMSDALTVSLQPLTTKATPSTLHRSKYFSHV